MTPPKPARKGERPVYEYRWCGDYEAIIGDHTSPEGNGVLGVPGENFRTMAPLNNHYAKPVNDAAKAANTIPHWAGKDEGEQTTEGAGDDAPSEEGSA